MQNQMYRGWGQTREERTLPEEREKGNGEEVAAEKVGK